MSSSRRRTTLRMKALALSYLQVSPSKRRIRRRKLTATAKALTESTVTDGSGQGNTSRAPSATAVQPQSVLENADEPRLLPDEWYVAHSKFLLVSKNESQML